jgi:hypothetical protein
MNKVKRENQPESFAQAITGVWRTEDPSHYKEFVGDTAGCTITGKYMEITVDRLLENFSLVSIYTGEAREFTLIHVIFRNLHKHILSTMGTGKVTMIDGDQYEYGNVPCDETEEIPEDAFPRPDWKLHAGAKTQGWLYFRKVPKDLHPKRLIIQIDVHDAGNLYGWVRDSETFEFMLAL